MSDLKPCEKVCCTCDHVVPYCNSDGTVRYYECRHSPPTAVRKFDRSPVISTIYEDQFPRVTAEAWCGQWEHTEQYTLNDPAPQPYKGRDDCNP